MAAPLRVAAVIRFGAACASSTAGLDGCLCVLRQAQHEEEFAAIKTDICCQPA